MQKLCELYTIKHEIFKILCVRFTPSDADLKSKVECVNNTICVMSTKDTQFVMQYIMHSGCKKYTIVFYRKLNKNSELM